ncbi:hypothetical protein OJAV_G00012190 [Oryzias javanicus]|uniref:EF-hand domain-containing protein n=1 Tax=Oryzias javanicus TaxID=123683 RepID=A0A437DP53_ORYJA|nr:hypothetical protein OJAV_G00012190 [Oryzias javanicus]
MTRLNPEVRCSCTKGPAAAMASTRQNTGHVEEIRRLQKRFKKLDLDQSGSLSVDEFLSLPELQQNPLVHRVIDIFDTDGDGEIDFRGERALTCRSSGPVSVCTSPFTWNPPEAMPRPFGLERSAAVCVCVCIVHGGHLPVQRWIQQRAEASL